MASFDRSFGGGVSFLPRRRPGPVSAFLLAALALTFLSDFFAQRPLWQFLVYQPGSLPREPWTLLTYALVGSPLIALPFINLLLFAYLLWWAGGELEERYGAVEYGCLGAALTVLHALAMTAGWAVIGRSDFLAGPAALAGALFVAWCRRNPRETVLFMFVLPVRADVLGWISLALIYFNTGPVLGLFALVAPLAAWGYVARARVFRGVGRLGSGLTRPRADSSSERWQRRSWLERLNPVAWWQRRRRRRQFERMMRASGLVDPDEGRPRRRDDRPN